MQKNYALHNEDAVTWLRTFPANSANLVITDPITCTEDNESRLLRDGMERAFSVEKSA